MTMMRDDSIGIDISKDFLDAHRLSDGAAARFENSPAGFRTLSTWLGDDMPTRVVFEATGAYHRSFERALSGKIPLVKVNPLQARRFAQACGTRVKTDEVDVRMLASFGNALALEPDRPIDGKQFELKELFTSRGGLIKDRIRLTNRLHTQSLALVKRQTKARIDQITRQLKTLQHDINQRLQDCPSRARANTILRSIPGIGEVAAATILIEMPEIGTLQKKKAASLTGLAPMTRQSGKWRGKAVIQGGRVSDLLCMSNLAHASPTKEHDDNDDFQRTTGRTA
jgi:transposase